MNREPIKQCASCKDLLASSEFNRNRSRPDGLQGSCRKCQSEYAKKKYNSAEKRSNRTVDASYVKELLDKMQAATLLHGKFSLSTFAKDYGIGNNMILEVVRKLGLIETGRGGSKWIGKRDSEIEEKILSSYAAVRERSYRSGEDGDAEIEELRQRIESQEKLIEEICTTIVSMGKRIRPEFYPNSSVRALARQF